MARPYWSGQITISLVSFGVKLFVATEAKSQISFHQIDRASGERVRYQKMVASAVENPPADPGDAPAPVQQSDIVKGYEYAKGQYVTIEPEELAHLRVPSKHVMEVLQFVDEAQISPAYFEKPYFVTPDNEAQTEAFETVRQAMIDTKKVALTKIAFGGREHVVCIAPDGTGPHGGMMAYTMRYAAEFAMQPTTSATSSRSRSARIPSTWPRNSSSARPPRSIRRSSSTDMRSRSTSWSRRS